MHNMMNADDKIEYTIYWIIVDYKAYWKNGQNLSKVKTAKLPNSKIEIK